MSEVQSSDADLQEAQFSLGSVPVIFRVGAGHSLVPHPPGCAPQAAGNICWSDRRRPARLGLFAVTKLCVPDCSESLCPPPHAFTGADFTLFPE